MSDLNNKFFELANKIEALNEERKLLQEQLDGVMSELKVGTYLQDPNTLLVYAIKKPTGRFVYFSDLDYVRTKKDTEVRGELSVKEAEAQGFTVPKKGKE